MCVHTYIWETLLQMLPGSAGPLPFLSSNFKQDFKIHTLVWFAVQKARSMAGCRCVGVCVCVCVCVCACVCVGRRAPKYATAEVCLSGLVRGLSSAHLSRFVPTRSLLNNS